MEGNDMESTEPTALPSVFLQPGRDRRLTGGHPWVYSNEVRMDAEAKALPAGTMVTLRRVDGKPVATGFFNPHTLIAFRSLGDGTTKESLDDIITKRLTAALALRERLFDAPCYRLVHAEADGLPGLIVDRYGDVLCCQANTAGMDSASETLCAAFERLLSPRIIVFRNDSPARQHEGLAQEVHIAKGELAGLIELQENGLTFFADLREGQKTGWFYDQRENRAFAASLAGGGRVLDLYSYSGGFGITAAANGASEVVLADRSEPALSLARQAAEANGVADRCRFEQSDVFAIIDRLRDKGERFDLVIADPPAFAKSKKDVGPARRGYRKLARLAAGLVKPGGFLFQASCSHNVEVPVFAEEVAHGITAAGRTGRVLRSGGAGCDHPVHPHLPESAYLKSVTLQLD
ncbi:MAG: class I SAM-dependent rRNA methyltransferase [Rhodospirillales bacterium]|nr:class I SAM-dependent rRNA methyltransferase [Rhodospirillales bacterium]